jgi:hypothetical protein
MGFMQSREGADHNQSEVAASRPSTLQEEGSTEPEDHAAEAIPSVALASAERVRIQLTNRMIATWSAMAANSRSSRCRNTSIEALPFVRHFGCFFDGKDEK